MKTPSKTTPPTTSILDAIRHLLADGNITTQENIRLSLSHQGIIVNQPKISRLLRKLGAVKIFNSQKETAYSLPSEPLAPPQHSQLRQLVLDIVANETMLVIHTNPGSASLIAGLLDQHHHTLQILGTLAGDDTLFVVPKSIRSIQEVSSAIQTLLKSML